jgi:hypothetical protein
MQLQMMWIGNKLKYLDASYRSFVKTTALCAQKQTNTLFESVASQRFQKVYCGSFDRQLL